MLKVRDLTESLEKKYNLDEGSATLDEAYEYEMDDELDYIMDDDSLSDDEKEQAISDLYSKYNYNESLNESFVEEWWGQTEDNPKDLQQYGLKVEPLKRKNDEVLYRFSGSLENINKARKDGYFYSLEIGEDENHSEDLNEALNEANGNDPHRYVKLENPYRALIFDNGEVSISSIRPYDDGDYYYANYNGNKNNIFWICQNGRVKEKIKADPSDETFSVVVDRLKELDSAVKQNMMHW